METNLPPIVEVKNSRLAIWSLVLGILGLLFLMVCIGPLFAIPGVICGHLAYGRIKRSGGALDGSGLALAGLITGYVCIALAVFVIPLLAAIAIPNFIQARDTAQRNTCINNLRLIDGAKQKWAVENHKAAEDTPTEAELEKYLPGGYNSLHCPAQGTYEIHKVGEPPTCSVPRHELP